jgi:hypothetical protein
LNTIRQKQGTFSNHIQIYGLKKQYLQTGLKVTEGVNPMPISSRNDDKIDNKIDNNMNYYGKPEKD